ncbi:hypothetical protein TrST_g12930 [Triparma strigata]|uniref:RanBP2-type domain-containing protein n=1 Tax=Triparma strigata TaxID=1606541 RepID=A0A9W7BP74_9STRA|nr:hypothetical protein TrST_g12930 [Triparma strigata]
MRHSLMSAFRACTAQSATTRQRYGHLRKLTSIDTSAPDPNPVRVLHSSLRSSSSFSTPHLQLRFTSSTATNANNNNNAQLNAPLYSDHTWTCPTCSNKNYLFRSTCNRKSPPCSTPRPPFVSTNKYHLDNIAYYTRDNRWDVLLCYVYDQDTGRWKDSLDLDIFVNIFKGLSSIESSSPGTVQKDSRMKRLTSSLTLKLKAENVSSLTPEQISHLTTSFQILDLKLQWILNGIAEDVPRWMMEGTLDDVARASYGMSNFGRVRLEHGNLKHVIRKFFDGVDEFFIEKGMGVMQFWDVESLCEVVASFGRIGISCKNIHEVVKDEMIADKIVKDGKSSSISRLIWGLTTLKHVEGCRGILEALERKEGEWEVEDIHDFSMCLWGAEEVGFRSEKIERYLGKEDVLERIANDGDINDLQYILKSLHSLSPPRPIIERLSANLNSNKNASRLSLAPLETVVSIITSLSPNLPPNLLRKICSKSPQLIKKYIDSIYKEPDASLETVARLVEIVVENSEGAEKEENLKKLFKGLEKEIGQNNRGKQLYKYLSLRLNKYMI